MAHKTLIGGTAHEISGGRTLINGTGYGVSKGRTLVGGTGYDLRFGYQWERYSVKNSVSWSSYDSRSSLIYYDRAVHQAMTYCTGVS